jgi:hypothetical protein
VPELLICELSMAVATNDADVVVVLLTGDVMEF